MAKPFEPPFNVTLKPSNRLRQMVIAAHIIALAASLANALPILYRIILATGIAAHLGYAVKRLKILAPYTIQHTTASGWEIGEGGALECVDILKSTVVTVFALWLHVRWHSRTGWFANAKSTILIMSDALDADDYRRLVVRLKTSFDK